MTALAPVPGKVDPLPFPTLADRPAGTYNNKAYAWAERIPEVVTAMNAQTLATYTNAVVAGEQAQASVGNASAAAQSESNAASSASTANARANAAAASAAAAASSASGANTSNVDFQKRMLGVKSSAPTVDNFGQPLASGAIYINSNNNSWNWWDGTSWKVGLTDPDVSVVDWANINNRPTTLGGYGITDAITTAQVNNAISSATLQWAKLDGKPSTVAGYNITDAVGTGGTQSISGTKTFTNGIKFGSQVGGTVSDLSKHLDLYGGTFGLAVSNGRLNAVVGGGALFAVTIGGTDYIAVSTSGLSVNGNVTASGSVIASGNVTAYSDARLKTDVAKIPDAFRKLQHLSGYTYLRTDTGVRQAGVLAQEVQAVLPEAVEVGTDANQTLAVSYGSVIGLLVEGTKEGFVDLMTKYVALSERVQLIESKVD